MLADFIGSLRRDPEFMQRVTHWEVVPARDGSYADIPSDVDPRITAALQSRGISRIYSHQLAAWNEVRAGRSVVLVSPTASGKTLAYNLPGASRASWRTRTLARCTSFPPRRSPRTSSQS